MKKIRVGVFGAGRGMTMIRQLLGRDDAELTAICDFYQPLLDRAEKEAAKYNVPVKLFKSFDEFIEYPELDAVVLANYANAHAPFAIRCLDKGLNVMSEVLPVQTMKEAVELVEAVERSGKVYAYAENYCYMPAPREMRRLFRAGKIGSFEYAEGEYMHNCEPIWPDITHGDPNHWRSNMYATFYCTHSMGPLIHISGLRPVSVIAFEMPYNERMARMGAKSGHSGVEIVTLENGAVVKSLHGIGCSCNSVWYSVYGSEGRLESARESAEVGAVGRIYADLTDRNENKLEQTWLPTDELTEQARATGHGGSDFYTTHYFIRKLQGDADAEIIDVYEALDMFLPGLLGYRSILEGNRPIAIPDLRDKAQRDQWRNDTACTDPAVAGDQWIPSYSKGNPEVPAEIYEGHRIAFENKQNKKQQLKLILFPKERLPVGLPEGYKVSRYNGSDADKDDWVRICKNGLLGEDAGREVFDECILGRKGIRPETDVFFLEHNGKKVATLTAIAADGGTGMGYFHMLAVCDEERGKGLGAVLMKICENKLVRDHCRIAYFTTDDFRKPACKTYLNLGYYPVNNGPDMPGRWAALLKEFGMDKVQMVTDSGAPDIVIEAAK